MRVFRNRSQSRDEDNPVVYDWADAHALAVDWWGALEATGGFGEDGPQRDATDQELAAEDLVDEMCAAGDPRAVDVMIVLADTSPDRDSLFYLGAAVAKPLVNDHGDALVETLVRAAEEHPRIRIALSDRHRWLGNAQLSQETLDRLWPWIAVAEDETTPF